MSSSSSFLPPNPKFEELPNPKSKPVSPPSFFLPALNQPPVLSSSFFLLSSAFALLESAPKLHDDLPQDQPVLKPLELPASPNERSIFGAPRSILVLPISSSK